MPPVRETRHLWVGNIPDNITEEKLVEYFERYGRIDTVKLLNKRSSDGGLAAFVDFVDIRCAIKAHEASNRLGDRELRTDYNEPASTTVGRQVESSRRYDRGGRGPGDEGYGSRQQNDSFQNSFPYKDEQRQHDFEQRDNDRPTSSRLPEGNTRQYRQNRHHVAMKTGVKADSDSGQSGSAVSASDSDSSESKDSDSDSGSESSASEAVVTKTIAKKYTALLIRNLSSRSADATIREGLYHEFKKHGDVGQIKVLGRETNRHAIVNFRRHEDVIKALETCRGKMFLGLEMDLAPYDADNYDDDYHRFRRRGNDQGSGGGGGGGGNDRSFNNQDDVFLFNATRTIFVGNIERSATSSDLKRMFDRYGEIVDIDIKKQGSHNAYAFIQYMDITQAVEAKKHMSNASSGRNRLKIGFGKGMPTTTIWIGGLPSTVTEQALERHFQRYGRIGRIGLDRERLYAVVTFDNVECCTLAHNELKDRPLLGKRVRVDYASRESQHYFYDHLVRSGQSDGRRYELSPPPPPLPSYRPRGKGYDDGPRGRVGMRHDRGGSKYHNYDNYDRGGPGFNDGGRPGRYDDYYRGSPRGGGYESDDFGQELREYNVTRERERAREREQELPPRRHEPPRRRSRHDMVGESDGERYYSRGEHSDPWPGDSGKERASRESSYEPREEVHRKGVDKRRDGDKKRLPEDKKVHVRRYESDEDIEAAVERKERRPEKIIRKKMPEMRDDNRKDDYYAYGNGETKDVPATTISKRKVKVEKDFLESTSADEEKLLPDEMPMKIEQTKKVKEARKELSEKATKKLKHKDGKKKRKHKKSLEDIPPQDSLNITAIEEAGEMMEYEDTGGREPKRLQSKIEKRSDVVKEEKRSRKAEPSMKSVIVEKSVPESSEKERRDCRPKSPTPEEFRDDNIPRKRPHSPEVDQHNKNTKNMESVRHSNGDHFDEGKVRKRRASRDTTPPPPPPPPPPFNKPKAESQPKDESVTLEPPKNPRESAMFQPYPSEMPGKHDGRAQNLSSHPSPTNSPAPAQTGSSTVPNSDDTLMELLRRHPVMWQGLLGLKNDSAAIQMHYVSGNSKLADYSLPKPSGTGPNGVPIPPVLRIAQRMRMEASQLEGVTKRMQLEKEHCLLLALPCGRDPLDVHAQTRALKTGFIAYLQQKLAAGIINISQPGSDQASFVLHVFPPCEFTHSHLSRVAPNLLDSATDSGHLMVVVATV